MNPVRTGFFDSLAIKNIVKIDFFQYCVGSDNKPSDHVWRRLPWFDLEKEVFLAEPIGVPGAWNFKLKEIIGALNNYDANFDLVWPGDLDEGLRAMVMGWKAYEQSDSIASYEIRTVIEYNEVDCKAMWKILKWLRGL